MPAPTPKPSFDAQYQRLLQHLALKGLRPKTIDAYSRAIRRIGQHFDHDIDSVTSDQLTTYFSKLLQSHSWTTVKLDLYGLKFYHQHVLQKTWIAPGLIKPPKVKRLPNIVTQAQLQQILEHTRVLSYRVFFLRCIAWVCAWARACACKLGISMRSASVCIFAMPKATKIDWCRCHR
jgi:site-specific recombinase XerD